MHDRSTPDDHDRAARFEAAAWRTSSYSAANNECVEVALTPASTWVGVRDSTRPDAATLIVSPPAFAALISTL
ncbi:DUF397 domain-containing protein [Streptomyces globisporus]|uniref:DUF397 domain-containing protein n=1 Tax=Streptomyces globisporus TaxID=1908 RepID=A0A927GPC5_STRGL|nr:DUF397 domain-containing protein [Streptomyces globisporus]